MNGRDEFQTGADPSPQDSDVGTATGSIPAAVHDVPGDSGTTGTAGFQSSPPPLRKRRSNAPFGYYVPDSVQNALTPLEPVGRQYMGWIGCALLLIGLFLSVKTYSYNGPAIGIGQVSVPSVSQTFWEYSGLWAFVLLVLSVGSAGLAFIRDYKWLLVTGGASLVILLLNFFWTFSSPFVLTSAHPSWGWILLFPGAIIIILAGAMRSTARDAENENGLNNIIASVQNSSNRR
jgi:hypothetical protein